MFKKTNIGEQDNEEIRRAFIRCFNTKDGQVVLSHLRRLTLERYMGPEISSDTLRHLEGQRYLVGYISSLSKVGL